MLWRTWEVGVHTAEARVLAGPGLSKLPKPSASIEVVSQNIPIIRWRGSLAARQHPVLRIILLLPNLDLHPMRSALSDSCLLIALQSLTYYYYCLYSNWSNWSFSVSLGSNLAIPAQALWGDKISEHALW